MSNGFDPNVEPETREDADAYVAWAAENFMRLSQSERRTYRTAVRCAHWLLVVAAAAFHLDDDVEVDRDALLEQLAMYSKLARAIERQRDRLPVEKLIVLRSSLDCWEPVGIWGSQLLAAARTAVSALMLIELHPLVDLWELECPDVWALLEEGAMQLAMINEADELEWQDYAIRPSESVTAKFTWQQVNNLSRRVGGGPLSAN